MFKKKSVEAIVAKLHQTVADLEAHGQTQHGKSAIEAENAAAAHEKRKAHEAERDLAYKVAGNIKALLA